MRARFIATAILTIALLPVLAFSAGRSLSRKFQSSETPPDRTTPNISLRFIEPVHPFASDAALEVEVELKNEGTQTVLVCRELSVRAGNSRPCAWEFSVRYPPGREPHEGCGYAVDSWPGRPWDDFATVLIKDWVALAPGDSIRAQINLGMAFCHRPPPGRYQITGILTSFGLDSQSINNGLLIYSEEIKKLPYPGWKGSINSNKLWITISPPHARTR
jgi:hypothetical protein